MSIGNGRYDVFVSYHEQDSRWVRGVLLPALHEAGLAYIDEDSFPLGQPRYEATERAIKSSDRVIAVLSSAYVADRHTNLVTLLTAEYGDATATWPLIPIRRDDVSLPPRLAMLVPLDMRREEEWEAQIDRLRTQLGVVEIRARPVPQCPYPGMASFTEDDAALFFGRSNDVAIMVERLRHSRLLTVIGPSGSGKSSLVRAGLYPRLRQSQIEGVDGWELVVVRPQEDVYRSLAVAFRGRGATSPGDLVGRIRKRATDKSVLILIDQAEEMFTLGNVARQDGEGITPPVEEQADPISRLVQLLRLLEAERRVRVVFTIRADFYGQLMSSALWTILEPTRFDVLPIQGDALREVIVEPAEQVGVYVETGLVERLVADAASEPGLLPFVQETMRMLWDRIQRRLLTLAGYEALVISRPEYSTASQGGLQVAMALHADEAIRRLDTQQRHVAQRLLIRLVQFGRGRDDVRRQQTVGDLQSAASSNKEFATVLDALARDRLITLSGSEQEPELRTVDLAHEALITGWPQFRQWLSERSSAEVARRYYVDLAERWAENVGASGVAERTFVVRAWGWLRGQDADRGLATADLAEAQRWLESGYAHEVGFDQPPITDLVSYSEAWHRARTRFWRSLTAFVVLLAVGVAVAAAIAWRQAGVAQTEAQRATALLLAEASERPAEEQDVAVLLGLDAVTRDPSVENRGALKTALESSPHIVRYLPIQPAPVLAVAASSDGRWLASSGAGPSLLLWDLAGDLMEPIQLEGHDDEVTALAFSPGNDWLASGSRDDTVRIWHLADLAREPELLTAAPVSSLVEGCRSDEEASLARDVRTVTFSPAGDLIAFAGHNGLVEIYATGSWAPRHALTGHLCDVMALAFDPDGTTLASGGRDDVIRLWDVEGGAPVATLGEPASGRNDEGDVRALAWRPGTTTLASAGNDGFVYLYRVGEGSPTRLGGHTERVFSLVFDAHGERLFSGAADRTIAAWDPDAGPQVPQRLLGHRGPVRGIATMVGGELFSGGQDGYLEIWDPTRLVRLGRTLEGLDGAAAVVLALDSKIVVGTEAGTIAVWDESVSAAPRESGPVGSGAVRDIVAITENLVAAVTADGMVGLWELASDRVTSWQASSSEIRALAYVADSAQLATADTDGVLRWWAVEEPGSERNLLQLVACSVVALEAHPEGTEILATCNEGDVRSIELENGVPIGVRHVGEIPAAGAAAFAPSGAVLVASSEGLTLEWESGSVGEGEPRRLDVVAGRTRDVSADPTGRTIATAADNKVWLWDAATGRQIGAPWTLGLRVRSVSFSSDGSSLIVAADPGIVMLLNVTDTAWRQAACGLVRRDLTQAEWDEVVGSGRPAASCVP